MIHLITLVVNAKVMKSNNNSDLKENVSKLVDTILGVEKSDDEKD